MKNDNYKKRVYFIIIEYGKLNKKKYMKNDYRNGI